MSPSLPTPCWRIEPVTHETTHEAVRFINRARRAMFPGLCAQLDDDVARWIQSGRFLCARSTASATEENRDGDDDDDEEQRQGSIIATVGYVPYDHRFRHLLPYEDEDQGRRTVELVRLFVVPRYRRCGLASALVRAAKQSAAKEKGVARLYLHTHPFLPGAIAFWEKHGFRVTCVEENDEVWQTTHMEALMDEGREKEGVCAV